MNATARPIDGTITLSNGQTRRAWMYVSSDGSTGVTIRPTSGTGFARSATAAQAATFVADPAVIAVLRDQALTEDAARAAAAAVEVVVPDGDPAAARIEQDARVEIVRKVMDSAVRYQDARANLTDLAAQPDVSPRALNDAVQRIARAAAVAQVWEEAERWLKNHDRKGERTFAEWAAEVVMHSLTYTRTDDGWSGRGNDLRRVEFDAALEAKQQLAETIVKGWTHHI
jgi:hypothetical protein